MRWEAWPALLATLAWAVGIAALFLGYVPSTPLGIVAFTLFGGIPFVLAAWTAARDWRARSPGRLPPAGTHRPAAWVARLVVGGVVGLLLLGSTIDATAGHARFFDLGPDAPIPVLRLVPGPSDAWAYLVTILLTAWCAVDTARGRLIMGAVLVAGGVLGGGVLVLDTAGDTVSSLSDANASAPTVVAPADACRDQPSVLSAAFRTSVAIGRLDGRSLGHVETSHGGEVQPTVVRFDTRWGSGVALLPEPLFGTTPVGPPSQALVSADDRGIDIVGGLAARHCQVVIDGRSAVAAFPALRWLVGENERTALPGAGLQAWRGTLDYWTVLVSGNRITNVQPLLAAVSVDGQPANWPFYGLRATIRAATQFEVR